MRVSPGMALALVLASLCVGCSDDGDAVSAGEVVRIPDDHPAAVTLDTAPTFGEFSEAATEEDLRFVCVRTDTWQVCVVSADGVLAVVPFEVPDGLSGTVESGSLEEPVSFPLDQGPVGIAGIDLSPTITFELDGEVVGSMGGPSVP